MIHNIFIPGEPVSGSQLKFNRKTGKAFRPKEHKQRVFTIHEYCEKYVEDNGLSSPVFDKGEPVAISVTFVFPYLTTHYRSGKHSHELKDEVDIFKIGNKDLDNMLKPLKDGLKGTMIHDDKQIVAYRYIEKIYGLKPGTHIILRPVANRLEEYEESGGD